MRVNPHTKRAPALTTRSVWILALSLLASAGCSPSEPQAAEQAGAEAAEAAPADGRERDEWHIPMDAPIDEVARGQVGELIEAMRPLDPTLTSDHHDRHLFAQRQLFQGLLASGESVGNAALQSYTGSQDEPYLVRRALLWVGGHAAPDSARMLLKELMMEYGHPIGDRTEAALVLAETSPELFLSLAAGHLQRRSRPTKTMPDDEFLVDGWVAACRATNQSPVAMLADVATNLLIQPTARYRAARRLSEFPNEPLGQRALETCLVESTGDGYLRRMAAQSLQVLLPRESGCRLFSEILAREADMNFAKFLDSMLQKHCRGDDVLDGPAPPPDLVGDER